MKRRTAITRAALVCAALLAPLPCAWQARAQVPAAPTRSDAPEAGRKSQAKGSISGRVVGEGGEPLAGANVQIRARGLTVVSAPAPALTTDAEGNFVAAGLDPGAYMVWAHMPGYALDPEYVAAPQAHRPGDFVTLRLLRGGVITGTVTDAGGAPVVAVGVAASRVRDHEGRPAPPQIGPGSNALTDDRGVYRIYGLAPGVYVVGTGSWWGGRVSAYDGEAPTFYPSATRDTAAEITVRASQEVTGIDIRHREERGRRVSGTLALPAGVSTDMGVNVTLFYAGSGATAGTEWVGPYDAGGRAFSLEGIPDGDYELHAVLQTREGVASSAAPQRVSVRGSDVTGLRLTLVPAAAASGTLSVEPAPEALRELPECKERAATLSPTESLVFARRDTRAGGEASTRPQSPREAVPDASGAFTLRHLEAGAFRVGARPLDENFYVRSVQLPAAPKPGEARATPTTLLNVGAGQQLSGLSVRLAPGAAGLAGRVMTREGVAPTGLRLHLVPAERERAEEVVHYAETTPAADGSFAFRHLAPGRYLLLARPPGEGEFPPRPASWDADSRARLRREAEAGAPAVELKPCQRVADFTLRYPHASGQ